MALQQELRVLVDAVMVHAAARMPAVLVAQVQLVVLRHKAQAQHSCLQVLVAPDGAPLASVGLELVDQHAQRGAGVAAVAIGAVGEHPAAAEALRYQI